jgi:hypothetical protein
MRHDAEDRADRRRATELLLQYLQAAGAPSWPGADGTTVEEVLGTYSQSAAAGRVPSLRELADRYPDLRDEFDSLLSGGN